MNFEKTGVGKASLFWSPEIELYLHVYRETVWYFESKECLGKMRLPRHEFHHLQFCHDFRSFLCEEVKLD